MSNELVFGSSGAPGALRGAYDFAINNGTLNDVQGNNVSDRFVACLYNHR